MNLFYTYKLYTERPLLGFEPGSFTLWGNSANLQATVLPKDKAVQLAMSCQMQLKSERASTL